jgi:pilus assembly protein Flp/PilA
MLNLIKRLFKDEEGQGLVEYGLILALIAVVVIAALVLLGDRVVEIFTNVEQAMS